MKKIATLIFAIILAGIFFPEKAGAADSETLPFPYIWNSSTGMNDFVGSGTEFDDWQWQSAYSAFRIFSTKNKWPGRYLVSAKPFDFPEGSNGAFTFFYNASADVTINLQIEKDGIFVDASTIDLPGNGKEHVYVTMPFEASGPARLRLEGILTGGNGNCYGSLLIDNINVKSSGADLAAVALLSPRPESKVAAGAPMNVEATFENLSSTDVANPVFCYSTGDDASAVREVFNGTLKGGESVNYSFTTPMVADKTGEIKIKIWIEHNSDIDTSNNTLTSVISTYTPYTYPYNAEFADEGNWQIIDTGADGYTWSFATAEAPGGDKPVLGFAAGYGSYDDYAISPAVVMPAGKSRVSFYYAGISGGTHLTLITGDTPDPSKMTEVLWEQDVNNNFWESVGFAIDLARSGNRYFAFHLTGGSDQVLISDFRVDNSEDLAVREVRFDQPDGFNLSTSTVTIVIANQGLSTQTAIELSYTAGNTAQTAETYQGSILPGETVEYTFKKAVDISDCGEYSLIGRIATPVGDDRFNDARYGKSLNHFENMNVPYINDFDDASKFNRWSFDNSDDKSGWSIRQSTYPYCGTFAYYDGISAYTLRHTNTSDAHADDWAFSECIALEKGEYDFSFFYRNDGETPRDFSLSLGNKPEAAAMTLTLMESEGATMETPEYTKWLGRIEIPESGLYYMGFNATGASGKGSTQIDRIEIRPLTDHQQLPWNADFAKDFASWEQYNPYQTFITWANDETDPSVITLVRPYFEIVPNEHYMTEGFLVSPTLTLEKGREVEISIDYTMAVNNTDVALSLWTGNRNHPGSFVKVSELEKARDFSTFTYRFTPTEADSEFYIALRSNLECSEEDAFSTNIYTYRVKNISASYTDKDSLGSVTADNGLTIKGNTVTVADGSEIEVYSLDGICIARGDGSVSIDAPSGIYIVRTPMNTRKIVL